jgi:c-di-AMP phosphodiesterase-like protein
MLKITLAELFIRGILEGFFVFLLVCAICKCKIQLKPYILSSLLYVALTYTIRMLPINFGVHSILVLMAIVLLAVLINKASVLSAIKAALITFLLLFALEAANVYTLQQIYGEVFVDVMNDPVSKSLTSLPSVLMLGIIGAAWYCKSVKKCIKNGDNDGNTGQEMGA